MFKRDVILAQEYLAFTLLNLFDLSLTGYLFHYGGFEGNAIAALILNKGNGIHKDNVIWFALYKCLLVIVVIAICEFISFSNIRKARFVITFGCFVYVLVVPYECTLIYGHITGPHSRA